MSHRGPSPGAPRPALVLAMAVALLGGCAEVHRGVEAVGRIGGAPSPAAEADSTPVRPDVKTVRPRGAPRSPAAGEDSGADESPRPGVLVSAVPTPRQIFDFHPAGPDAWRQPFVIDTSDGPLAADVRRSSAELRAFLADQKAGRDKRGVAAAERRCGEDATATGKPGCVSPPARAASAHAAAPAPQ